MLGVGIGAKMTASSILIIVWERMASRSELQASIEVTALWVSGAVLRSARRDGGLVTRW
jgi:hypothetical protein